MRITLVWKRIAMTVVAALLISAPVSAQTDGTPPSPGEIARECIDAMHETTRATIHHITGAAARGIRYMIRLSEDGAPDAAIAHAARETIERIDSIAAHGKRRVHRIARRCVEHLREIDAPPPLIQTVAEARDASIGAINGASARAKRRVREVLHRLLSDESRIDAAAA